MIETGVYILKWPNHTYIGSTTQGFTFRMYRHFGLLRDGAHYNTYMQRVFDKHGLPYIGILERVEKDDCIKREQFFMDALQPNLNIRKLADNNFGTKRTEEQKERASMAQKGRKLTEEHKAKLRKAKVGYKQTPEHIAAKTKALTGGKRTKEQKDNLSRASFKRALTDKQVIEIRTKEWGSLTHIMIGKLYGVSGSTIGCVQTGKTYKYLL